MNTNGNALALIENTDATAEIAVYKPDMTAISRYQTPDDRTFETMCRLAEGFAKSGMFAAKSPDQALTILMTGGELGLMPAQSMRGIHVVQGRPVLSAELMVAVVRVRSDICHYFQIVHSDHERATYRTHRVGEPEPVEMSYTIQDATRAKLTGKDVWQQHPSAMLRARCSSALVRAVYSDIVLGLYTPEEVEHIVPAAAPTTPKVTAPTNETGPQEAYREARAKVANLLKPLADREAWLDKVVARGGTRKLGGLTFEALVELAAEIESTISSKPEDDSDPFKDDLSEAEKGEILAREKANTEGLPLV